MFDSYTLRAGDQHHHHRSEVHEHRAPTDASVALLREMEQAALDKIMGSVRLEGCAVDCHISQMRDVMGGYKFFIRYKLGHQTRDVRIDYAPRLSLSANEMREDAVRVLRDELAKDIANGLLLHPLQSMMGGKFPLFP